MPDTAFEKAESSNNGKSFTADSETIVPSDVD